MALALPPPPFFFWPHILTLTISSLTSLIYNISVLFLSYLHLFCLFISQTLGSLDIFHGPGLHIKHYGFSPWFFAQFYLDWFQNNKTISKKETLYLYLPLFKHNYVAGFLILKIL